MNVDEAILPISAVVESEPTLLERARRGELEAFELLLIEHERGVLRLAFQLLRSSEDARDVSQEAFLRLHRNLSKLDGDRELRPWLYSVTVNLCRDMLRRRRHTVPIDAAQHRSNANPEQDAESAERRRVLAEALHCLAGKERTALVLRDVEGLSTAEVAERLGSTESTVRSQISSARLKLRNAVVKLTRRKP